MKRASHASIFGAALLAAACATTPQPTPDKPGASAETPEVPYKQPAPPPPKPVVTEPAKGGQVPAPEAAKPAEPPPPPKPAFDSRSQSLFQDGVAAASAGDLNRAERAFKDVLDASPKADYAWTNLGMIEERRGDLSAAEKNYRRAIELKPDQDAAWDSLARLYCRTKRCPQIETELRQKIAENPASLGPRTALVYALLQQGKYDVGAAEAKKVLKADERNVRAMQLLAQIYFRDSKVELSKMVLENARAIDTGDAATHNALGMVYLVMAVKQPSYRAQAREEFKQAATLKPDFAEAKNNYGAMLNEAQDFDNAIRELEGAVAAAPQFASAHLNLGNAYRGKLELPKAIAQYQEVLKLKPELPDTYFNLAILHLDSDVPGLDVTTRYKTSIDYFGKYKDKGGKDERVEQYVKDANKGIEKEERRKEREKKDALKKAARAEEDAKKAKEDEAAAARKAQDDAAAAAAAEAKARAAQDAADQKKKTEEENAAKKKLEAEAAAKKKAEEAAAKGKPPPADPKPASGKLSDDK